MKITMKKNDYAIVFEDKDAKGRVRGAIGFQVSLKGDLIIYIKGYKIDAKKFPGLKGYHGYKMTSGELNELVWFLGSVKVSGGGTSDGK